MSWYVEYLIINYNMIKSTGDIYSDAYSDLISVENAINILYKTDAFTTKDWSVIASFINLSEINIPIDVSPFYCKRRGFYKTLSSVANKIAELLGDDFSDEGYIEFLKTKYPLSEEQVARLRSFMSSQYRHRIMRKPYKENNETI